MTSNRFNDHVEISLSRDLKLFDITMIGIGAMIGAGIFVLTGIAAGQAGPALVLVFLLNGLVTSLTAMAYAELGSILPGAGGGYLWVKEALGGAPGFLAGWMGWFASAIAGSLYALAFGSFAHELWISAELPMFGLPGEMLTLGFTTLVIAFFIFVNYMGASETGAVGNIITMTKIIILAAVVVFGLITMFGSEGWHTRFTEDFFPHGASGVLIAMGLTFIAFEGYEIIAQSGEEVVNPKFTIPRAVFISIVVAVVIYVLVAFTAIGAIEVPAGLGLAPHEYLGEQGEMAIVEAADQFFPLGIGAVLLLVSGLASTMSALNATTYSSSRVSFAMGRDGNLPTIFSDIHPKRHTPYWAVILSGLLIAGMAWFVPIEDVAAAADIMFLLLFIQVNISVIVLRRKRPDLERGFLIPIFPLIPILGLLTQTGLAIYLFFFSPTAWYITLGWIGAGLLLYYAVFSRIEAMERPREILLEEVLVTRDYSVMVPVASIEQARILGRVGAILAEDNDGDMLALYVPRIPQQLTLADGRLFLREGRPYLEAVIEQARQRDVPVHTMIRLGRNVAETIRKTAIEDATDLILLGWPGYTRTPGQMFGSVIDRLLSNTPSDVALVRYREHRALRSILVPVAGGRNSRPAVRMAITMARGEQDHTVTVRVINIVPEDAAESTYIRAQKALDYSLEGNHYEHIKTEVVRGSSVADTILGESTKHDLVVIGSTEESLFRKLLTENIPRHVAERAETTVIIVRRRSGVLRAMIEQAVMPSIPESETDTSTS